MVESGINSVEATIYIVEPAIQIVKPFVLSNSSQKEPDQDGQRHLNKRLLDEARRVQPASMIAKPSAAPVRQ